MTKTTMKYRKQAVQDRKDLDLADLELERIQFELKQLSFETLLYAGETEDEAITELFVVLRGVVPKDVFLSCGKIEHGEIKFE